LQGDVDECMEDRVEKLGYTIGKTRGKLLEMKT
jgi:hypothetical protein